MTLPVVLRAEASRDAAEARDYLDAQQAGRGQAFLNRLKEALTRIAAMPELYSVVWRNVRAARLRKVAYVAYYRVQG
jgi:plasmid stabilization system protein ParE